MMEGYGSGLLNNGSGRPKAQKLTDPTDPDPEYCAEACMNLSHLNKLTKIIQIMLGAIIFC
jgi:hypothetical protein